MIYYNYLQPYDLNTLINPFFEHLSCWARNMRTNQVWKLLNCFLRSLMFAQFYQNNPDLLHDDDIKHRS